jgi:hypothetical protein
MQRKIARDIFGTLVLIAAVGTVAGCGDDSQNLGQFVGTWVYVQSDGSFACPGQAATPETVTGKKILGKGVTSDLVDLSDMCNYKFDVNDKTATVQANQACLLGNGNLEAPTTWRFTLLGPVDAEEAAVTKDTEPTLTTCTFTMAATLKKISKD